MRLPSYSWCSRHARLATLLIIVVLLLVASWPVSGVLAVAQVPGAIPLYGLFEVQVALEAPVANPYDPAQIDLVAQFTAPSGERHTIPAFWMQAYRDTCVRDCVADVLQPVGTAGWRVRFTPDEIGAWTYSIERRPGQPDQANQVIQRGTFAVVESDRRGFIRVGSNPRYFAHTTGESYFPVGVNLGWSWQEGGGTRTYLDWLRDLQAVGANYARLYVDVPWFIGLDWRGRPGNYAEAQEDAWRLDTILSRAEDYGIALQVVLVWHQGFISYGGLPVNAPASPPRPNTEADWGRNPLNVLRGGPLPNAVSFFTTSEGRDLLKRRLRYMVARWGYSTSVFAWEVIDQLDRVVTTDTASNWLAEMAGYLREVDPFRHLVTAGVRDQANFPLIAPVALDFTQARFFQRRPIEPAADQVVGALNILSQALTNAERPVLLSEFSLNPWFEPTSDDPTGVHVLQTMWTAALSGAGGAAASGWWDTYIFPQNVQRGFAALSAFTRSVPFALSALTPVSLSVATVEPVGYEPLKVTGFGGTFGAPPGPDVTYRITPDGIFPPISQQSAFIYGLAYNVQYSRPQRYVVAPPVDTTLTVTVRRVSEQAPAKLVVIIDGVTAGQATLSPGNTNVSISVPIQAGEHTVIIDNLGDDFLELESFEINSYIVPLRTVALADRERGVLLAWVQHRQYTWQNVAANVAAQPVSVALTCTAMPAGLYLVELWDPLTGNVIGQEDVYVEGTPTGTLTVTLVPVTSMIAVRAFRLAEPGALPTVTPVLTATPRISPTPTLTPIPTATSEGTD